MGVCVPEEYGGAGADFLSYILVLEELSRARRRRRRDGCGAHVRVHAADAPVRHRRAARAVRAAARARRAGRLLRADRVRLGLRRGRPTSRARSGRRRLADHAARSSGSRTRRSEARCCCSRAPTRDASARGVSAFIVDTEHVTITRTEEKLGLNSSATNDIAIDTVVDARSVARRAAPRLPDRDGDARRRPDRDRGAGGRDRAGGVRRRAAVLAGAACVRAAHRGVPGDPAQAREHVDGDRRGAPARATAPRG